MADHAGTRSSHRPARRSRQRQSNRCGADAARIGSRGAVLTRPRRSWLRGAARVLLGAVWVIGAATAHGEELAVAGYVEDVRIFPGGLLLRAKLDTGARHSSLNAAGMKRFDRDGEQWVQFTVISRRQRSVTFEKRVVRTASIRRHGGRKQDRPVIVLGICLGSVYKEVDVNLIDRTGFNYQMLIGRSFLGGSYLIDPTASRKLTPQCPSANG